jgi:AmmeMemoRadiSam system protein B
LAVPYLDDTMYTTKKDPLRQESKEMREACACPGKGVMCAKGVEDLSTRKPDFAGSWYPSKESECRKLIEEFSRGAIPCPATGRKAVGGIVPHAGWFYSGRIACNVIKCLKGDAPPDTMVVFGKHLHPGSRNSIMKEGRWATPIGELEIDQELAEELLDGLSFVVETDAHHEQDNTIELQLPFIKHFFPEVKILPIGVPPTMASLKIGKRLGEIAETMGRKILILGSTDLTHYGYNYGYTPRGGGVDAVQWVKNENDRRVIQLMLKMDAEGVIEESLRNYNACCSGAAATAIAGAKRLGAMEGLELLYSTSYDIRADSSFVGYVGIVFS